MMKIIDIIYTYRIDDKLRIRIGDFGLSEDIYSSKYFRQGEEFSVKLPVKWMALESLLDRIFSEKTDVVSYFTQLTCCNVRCYCWPLAIF